MRTNKSKNGISLIVLIITIIVMIILAAAIILSISNSGIVDKANKAKTDSDSANLKEYVNVLEAEWELGTKETSKEAYVNAKLEEKGYTQALLMEDGTLYTNLKTNTKKALQEGIQIGERVNYTITKATTYTPDEEKTGCSNSSLTTLTDLTWIYIGVSDKGELLISNDVSKGATLYLTTETGFSDQGSVELDEIPGWFTGPEELNTVCDKLYTTDNGTARNMNIDDVNNLLGYIGNKGEYRFGTYPEGKAEYTTEPKDILEIAAEIGFEMEKFTSYIPENYKTEVEYKSNFYIYSKSEVAKMKYPENINYVFPPSGTYWLASSCILANFYNWTDDLFVRCVNSSSVQTWEYADPYPQGVNSIRPVVSLTSNITKSSDSNGVIWNFE